MRFGARVFTLAALGFAFAAVAQARTLDTETVDTITGWSGSTIGNFGYPDTATYGQTITIPGGRHVLKTFSFLMLVPSTNVFRGEVYAWDGSEATGKALWQSQPTRTNGSSAQVVTFHPGVRVMPGSMYIIFASVSKNYQDSSSTTSTGYWGAAATSYGGGQFFFQNNGGNPSTWTSTPWDTCCVDDIAFRAVFQ
jgi:hypothetical protein